MKRRHAMLGQAMDRSSSWDVLIIGGGATGLGCAIDSSSRGYRTLLVEGSDFAKGTSSRSTKLVHGGVRYLRQGSLSLVYRALRERGLLKLNAPHLVHDLPFVVPNYKWWEPSVFGFALGLYDRLAGGLSFGRSCNLATEELLKRLPTIEPKRLRGGILYYDGQFDDARLAINMAQTAADLGATLLNYVRVSGLIKLHGRIRGIRAQDVLSETEFELLAKVVVNATGVWCDEIRRMDNHEAQAVIRPSRGIHLVLDKSFLPADNALMVPRTDDDRVFFVIPWKDRVLVGTTETPTEKALLEPRPLDEEVEYLLRHTSYYLTKTPARGDVLSLFAGLRPLIAGNEHAQARNLSRDHRLFVSNSGLISIAGGKWTTYRKMAQDTIEQAAILGGLKKRPCVTRDLRIHGFHRHAEIFGGLAHYGSDAPRIQELFAEQPGLARQLHPNLSLRGGEIVWAVREEMAVTVDDVLSRRSRALFLDALAAMDIAPQVAELMAEELGRNEAWQSQQVESFRALATGYLP